MWYLICYRNGDECQGNGEFYSRHETLAEAEKAFNQLEEGYSSDGWNAGFKSASFIVRQSDTDEVYNPYTDECLGNIYRF